MKDIPPLSAEARGPPEHVIALDPGGSPHRFPICSHPKEAMMFPKPSKIFTGILTILAFGLSLMVTSSALAQQNIPAPLKTATKGQLGTFLVDSNGMTLYTFDNDQEPGKSTCLGGCARAWPPYAPKAGDPAPIAPLSTITRDEGSKQYAYKGKPLYYFKRDKKPGDTTGHGAGDRWWVVKP